MRRVPVFDTDAMRGRDSDGNKLRIDAFKRESESLLKRAPAKTILRCARRRRVS